MTANQHFARAESTLRQQALAYPETHEEFPWEHRAIKVKGKTFLFMYREETFFSLSVKLPLSGKAALAFPFASPTGYGLGKSGWITARFDGNADIPLPMLQEWLDESFRAIAPKKLLAQLENAELEHRQLSAPRVPARRPKPKKKPSQ
jgi:predicted DNA-binding protein (MmcQ/YjbR family)